jgi:glycine/D-amino acid oxidase-like deaminating enzyme
MADVIVIGAGATGITAAIAARELGASLGSKLFDLLLHPHNLAVQVAVAFVDMQSSTPPMDHR